MYAKNSMTPLKIRGMDTPIHQRQELPQHVVALALDWPEQRRYLRVETQLAQIERTYEGEINAERYARLLDERAAFVRTARARLRQQALIDTLAETEEDQ